MRDLIWPARRLRRFTAMLLLVAGCSDGAAWETKDVTGVLPSLEFALVSEDGEPVTQAAFRGRTTAVFFGYTRCPDVCPVTMARLRRALAELPAALRGHVAVLFVSVDPGRDTPASLAEYTAAFGPEFVGVTGSQAALRRVTRRYRATFGYGGAGDGDYAVSHPSAVYVFDDLGRARLLIRPDDPVDAITRDLERLAREAVSTGNLRTG